jgi:hypothetical protein
MNAFGYVLVIAGTLAAFVPMIVGTLVHHRAVTTPAKVADAPASPTQVITLPSPRQRGDAHIGV